MKHQPKRCFGQNFLKNQNIILEIVHSLPVSPGATILEIGPGQGALTQSLLSHGYSVIAIEIDRDLVSLLQSKKLENLTIISQDVLTVNLDDLISTYSIQACIGNLPYNISTPFLLKFTELVNKIPGVFMVQQEVAQRLYAKSGTKDFGRLTLAINHAYTCHTICKVPPESFYPAPKVMSEVVSLSVKDIKDCIERHPLFTALVNEAFQYRRKTLKNALSRWDIDFDAANINPQLRPETLSELQFNHLAKFASLKPVE